MWARRLTTSTILAVVLLVPFTAAAQPLADRVPADALIYVGWRGAASPGPGYEASHLKAVLDASDLPQFFNEFLPNVLARVGQESPEMAGATTVFVQIGRAAWRCPTALFVGPVELKDPPTPHAGLLIQAGDEADKLHKTIESLVQLGQRNVPFPIVTFNNGGLVGVVVGYQATDFQPPAAAGAAAGLQGAANFRAAMTAIGNTSGVRDPMLVGYVDAEGIRTFAERAIQISGNAQAAKEWPQIRDALGLQGLRQITFVSGFSGKGWEDNLFIAATPPRKGLLALLDARPISDDALRLIPRSARIANAVSFDLSRLLAEVRDVTGQLDLTAHRQIDEALRQASAHLGIDVERDLIGTLGHEWVSYSSPAVGGNGLLGMVAVNRLRDPAKAQQTLVKLGAIVNQVLEEQLKGEEVTVKLNTVQIDGMDVTYLGTPFVSPAWGVRNGNLFVALYPQNVVAAARAATAAPAAAPAGGARAMAPAAAGEGSILDNPDFVAMRQALPGRQGAASISAIQFMDLRLTAPDAYPTWLAISRLAGFGDLFGVQSPPMLLPPLGVLSQHLGAAAGAAWGDDAGWHYRSYSPFPGSTILANDPLATYVSTVGPGSIGVLLPSLNRAREQANRIKSASNLRQIGLGCLLYANDHNGKFPKDLAEIFRTQDLTPEVFVNPRGQSTPPPGLTKENAGPVNEINDYVYVGAGLDSRAGQGVVVAYENPDRNRDGVNILYADGHVDWVPMEQAREQIEKAKSRAGGGGGL